MTHAYEYGSIDSMNPVISPAIANAVSSHDRPLEVRDNEGRIFVVMTNRQFQQFVYDDSDVSDDEMLAAASVSNDLEIHEEDSVMQTAEHPASPNIS